MLSRRNFIALSAAASIVPAQALAQGTAPSADRIQRSLEIEPKIILAPKDRVTVGKLKRRPELRRAAPSIDIQAINFEFGSAEIPYNQYWKAEEIAIAIRRILRRRHELFLIEGHTDAVGSRYSNQILSERRARSLRNVLVREFSIPHHVLETEGYGEDYLLVPVPYAEWRNRRVTLRRITDFISG